MKKTCLEAVAQQRNGRAVLTVSVLAAALWMSACGQTEFSASEHLQRAEAFQKKGDLRASVIELKNLLQSDPQHAEGRWQLGLAYLELHDGAAALSALERGLDLGWKSPDAPLQLARARLLERDFNAVLEQLQTWQLTGRERLSDAHVLRAQAYLGKNNPDEAQREYRAALDNTPEHPPALTGLARISLFHAKVDEARQLLETALKNNPDHVDAWDLLGELHRAQGRLAEAEAAFTRLVEVADGPYMGYYKRALVRIAREDWQGAGQDYKHMRQLGKTLFATAYVEGLLHFHKQEYAAAAESMEQSLRGNAQHLPAMFFAGASHFALGHWQQAESRLARYLQSRPDASVANYLLAAVRLRGGQLEDAQGILERLLVNNPEDVAALDMMAGIHAARGDEVASLDLLRQRVSLEPESPHARMRLASMLLQRGETQSGMAELETARQLAPEDAGINLALITQLLEQGHFERVLEESSALAEKHPERASVRNLRGAALLGLQRVDDAQAAFNKSLELDPGNLVATRNLAIIAFRQGDPEQARAIFEQALAQQPDDLRLLMELANFEAQQGNPETAEKLLKRAMAAHPQALEPRRIMARKHLSANAPRSALSLLQAIKDRYSAHPAFLQLLAEAQLAAGQRESAINTLHDLARITPDSAEVHFRLGVAQQRAGRQHKALESLNKAVAIDENHARALLELAGLQLEAGQYDKALAFARRARGLAGYEANGYLLVGDVLRARKKLAQAHSAYVEAYRLEPSAQAAVKRFETARASESLRSAREPLVQHVAEYPGDHPSRGALASSYIETGDYEKAVPHYEVLVEHFPENPTLLNNLAFLYQRLDDARALELARKAHQLRPEEPRIKDTLGVALLDYGDPDQGLALLEEAHSSLPDDAAIAYHHALALVRNDRQAEALNELNELLATDAAFSEKADARRLREQLQ